MAPVKSSSGIPCIDNSDPVFGIGTVAQLTGCPPRMIREYETQGLIRPRRRNGQRRFSQHEVQFIRAIRTLLAMEGMSVTSLKMLLSVAPCWKIKQCPHPECPARKDAERPCWEIIAKLHDQTPRLCTSCPIYLLQSRESDVLPIQSNAFPTVIDQSLANPPETGE